MPCHRDARFDFLELFGVDLLPESCRHILSITNIALGFQITHEGDESGPRPAAMVLGLVAQVGRLRLIRRDALTIGPMSRSSTMSSPSS